MQGGKRPVPSWGDVLGGVVCTLLCVVGLITMLVALAHGQETRYLVAFGATQGFGILGLLFGTGHAER